MRRFYESRTITNLYSKYRPGITRDVVEEILDFLRKRRNLSAEEYYFEQLLDVGCGSGQSTNPFAPYFRRIDAIDVSANQIAQAKSQNQFSHVCYYEAAAENTLMCDGSVDLIVSNAAAHWFDLPKFFQEARRVLNDDGCVAVMCPSLYRFEPVELPNGDEAEMGKAGSALLVDYVRSGVYDADAYGKAFNKFRDIFDAIPSKNKKYTDGIKMYRQWTLDDAVGYLKSMDSSQNYLEAKLKAMQEAGTDVTDDVIKSVDLGERFRSEVKAMWKVEHMPDEDIKLKAVADMWLSLASDLTS